MHRVVGTKYHTGHQQLSRKAHSDMETALRTHLLVNGAKCRQLETV
jgi:hypothetical protein